MSKECVCGAEIRNDRSLCRECAEIYGTNLNEWPEVNFNVMFHSQFLIGRFFMLWLGLGD